MAFACCCMIDSKYTLYTDVTKSESVQGNKTPKKRDIKTDKKSQSGSAVRTLA